MKKTAAFAIILVLLVSMFLSFEISHAATTSSVTLSSSGTILTSSSSNSCIISISGSTVTVKSSSSTIYSGTDATTAFADAFSYCNNGGTVTVDSGTYTATYQALPIQYNGEPADAMFFMGNCSNEQVNFQSGAILKMPAETTFSVSVLEVWYCNNITITGATINGNAPNEYTTSSSGSCGMVVYDSNNVLTTESTFYNCRTYGWTDGANYADVKVPCGVTYSTAYDCYWNGICFADPRIAGDYAIGDTVYNCSDVGISTWDTHGVQILNNNIYGINGTDGFAGEGTGSHYGIITEDGSTSTTIEDNTISGCPAMGIGLGEGYSGALGDFAKGNKITMSSTGTGMEIGLCIQEAGYATITENSITNWGADGSYGSGIYVLNGTNNIISFNTLTTGRTTSGLSPAIYVGDEINSNNAVFNNTITAPLAADSYGVELGSSASGCMVEGNTVQAYTGIVIASGATNSRLGFNKVSACTTGISNSGTGTITLPASSAILVLNCSSVYGTVSPIAGYYSKSTSSQVIITLTPKAGYVSVLNVDGSNVTLSSNSYTLSMTNDHSVYALFTTQT